MKKAFTLVELLVVIGILGILVGVLIASFNGSSESARTAQCLSNMRNLAAACQTYGAEHGRYPLAGSVEYMTIDESDGMANAKAIYREVPGWISWNSDGAYRNKPTSHQASSAWMTSLYDDDDRVAAYVITNGALCRYVSGNRETFVCPKHKLKKASSKPRWSYLMNAYFGWDTSQGSDAQGENIDDVDYGHLARADRVLLFSEIPFDGTVGGWQPDGSGSGTDCDCVLQFDAKVTRKNGSLGANSEKAPGNENIGFNHKSGKETFANVAFADGHCEKLRLPKRGLSDTELRNLTAWLCMGEDISFDGKEYKQLEN